MKLDDVKAAIHRAEAITSANLKDQKKTIRYRGYSYFEDNPALSVHEAVRTILKECGLMA